MMYFNEISRLLQQKAPFVYVDRVLELEENKRIVSIKNVSGSEAFTALHFPGNAVYPGIFIIESIAQTASILLSKSDEISLREGQFLALGGIQRLQFMRAVKPGDTLRIEVEIIKAVGQMAIVKAVVKIEDTVTAEGQMTFGVGKNE